MPQDDDYKALKVKPALGRLYDSIEFTLASGQTDYNIKVNESAAFSALKSYTTINIRTTKEITLKLNDSDLSAITIPRTRPFELDDLMEIINMFISNNSGETASIKIIGVRKGD